MKKKSSKRSVKRKSTKKISKRSSNKIIKRKRNPEKYLSDATIIKLANLPGVDKDEVSMFLHNAAKDYKIPNRGMDLLWAKFAFNNTWNDQTRNAIKLGLTILSNKLSPTADFTPNKRFFDIDANYDLVDERFHQTQGRNLSKLPKNWY